MVECENLTLPLKPSFLGKTLVIIVSSYPYGFGEPFLEDELAVIADFFEKIYFVIPDIGLDRSTQRYAIPANAQIIFLDSRLTLFSKALSFFSLPSKRMRKHLFRVKKNLELPFSKILVKTLLAYEARDIVFRKLLTNKLKELKVDFNQLYLYTYWFTDYTYSIARLKEKIPRVKAFTRGHGWDIYFERHDPPYLPLRGYTIQNLDKVFTISDDGRNYLLKKIPGVDPSKIVAHRLGVEAGCTPVEKQFTNDHLNILSLSFIAPVKRTELLIEALEKEESINIYWHHVGDGTDDYSKSIKELAANKLGDKKNIQYRFHGTMDKRQVYSFFKDHWIDLLVNTSYSEGLPVSIMESMAHAVPAVAPDVGGISEIISDGKNGFLMSPNPDANELKNIIGKFYKLNKDSKKALRDNAFQTWDRDFNNSKNYLRFVQDILALGTHPFRVCSRCILDSADDPGITFDERGICSICRQYDLKVRNEVFKGDEARNKLEDLVGKIKKEGIGKPYDCIIGLSGGVDSTYVAWKVKELGLRPLAIHLDNGWDSELAVKNIENIVRRLDLDFITYVIDWEEFKDLQLSYFKAGVIDLELPTDHAIVAILYQIAKKYGVKYVLSGHNLATEGFLPEGWIHYKFDVKNIRGIHKRFGKERLKTFPLMPFFKRLYYEKVLGIYLFSLLNYIEFDKNEAKRFIMDKLKWRDYGAKHYESIFTRFYQGYILPRKFKVDKRKSHFSTLICSGQLAREKALELLMDDPYPSREMMEADKVYVLKKLGFDEKEFEEYMKAPVHKHTDYPSYINTFLKLRPFKRAMKKLLPLK